MSTKIAYIVDIDGTLAKIDHRLHFIQSEPKQWDAFFDACVDDEPIVDVIHVIRSIGFIEWHGTLAYVIYLTGRPERVRRETTEWLRDHRLPEGKLFMRKDGDHRPDTIAKRELMEQLQADGYKIAGVFEDRPSVCRLWRSMGLTVFQMNHEEF